MKLVYYCFGFFAAYTYDHMSGRDLFAAVLLGCALFGKALVPLGAYQTNEVVDDQVYTPGHDVEAPLMLHSDGVKCTEEARHSRLRFKERVRVVGKDGKPRTVIFTTLIGEGMDDEVKQALSGWRFKPGIKDGRPVSTEVPVDVDANCAL